MNETIKNIITTTQEKFKLTPSTAQATYASSSALQDGYRSEVQIRDHTLTVDEPESFGGTDTGPSPVELILAALSTCQEITYRAYATALDIPLQKVSVKLEGALDLRGFFGVDDTVRPGYQKIHGTVTLESDADEEVLQKLCAAVNAHCPVLDMLEKPVPVDLTLDIRQPD